MSLEVCDTIVDSIKTQTLPLMAVNGVQMKQFLDGIDNLQLVNTTSIYDLGNMSHVNENCLVSLKNV